MTNVDKTPKSQRIMSYVINEKGEEVPITEDMVEQSLSEIKLQSMGVHTGFNKIITDDMLEGDSEL